MRYLTFALAILLPISAHAAGSDSYSPPKPTGTTKFCAGGKIWDKKTKKCVYPNHSSLNDDARYEAVRELAYAGQYENSLKVLASMTDQSESRVLTYYGFNNRKAGRVEEGMKYYQQAVAADPNNILVRSYMGQGYVEQGNNKAAWAQLREIEARGGTGTWPETALRKAIKSGKGYSY